MIVCSENKDADQLCSSYHIIISYYDKCKRIYKPQAIPCCPFSILSASFICSPLLWLSLDNQFEPHYSQLPLILNVSKVILRGNL